MSPTGLTKVEIPRRRRRPALSCETCRGRKVKCDRAQPCNHCIASRTKCIYRKDSGPAVRSPGGGVQPQRPVAPHVFAPQTRTDPSPGLRLAPANHAETSLSVPSLENHVTITEELPSLDTQAVSERVGNAEDEPRPHQTHVICDHGHQCQHSHLNQAVSQASDGNKPDSQSHKLHLRKSRLFGRSHWSYSNSEFMYIAKILSNDSDGATESESSKQLIRDINNGVQKCKSIAKGLKTIRPTRSPLPPQSSLEMLQKHFSDILVRTYISHFESAFRIVHIPSFWQEYEQCWSDVSLVSPVALHKIKLVIAIGGSIIDKASFNDQRSTFYPFIYEAQTWLAGPLEKDRLSINALQVHLLAILARQTCSFGGDLIWLSMGTVVRVALQMGLHRDPKHFAGFTKLQAEIRRRLWWTILEMNLQAALDSGASACILSEDFDTEPPSNENDEELCSCPMGYTNTRQSSARATSTSLQRVLSSSYYLRLRLLRQMNEITGPDIPQEDVMSITSQLQEICRDIPVHIPDNEPMSCTAFRHNFADLMIRRFLLVFHRPLASRARTDSKYYFSRKVSVDSALTLLSLLNNEFLHLVARGGGMFKTRLVHLSLTLGTELLRETGDIGYQSSQLPRSRYTIMLSDALGDALTQWISRMEYGENSARLHMKLSMVLSQATQSGSSDVSLQQLLLQAALDSLAKCLSALQGCRTSSGLQSSAEGGYFPGFEAEDNSMLDDLDFDEFLRSMDLDMNHAIPFGLEPAVL